MKQNLFFKKNRREWWNQTATKKKTPYEIYMESVAKRTRRTQVGEKDDEEKKHVIDGGAPTRANISVTWEMLPPRLRYGRRDKSSWLYLNADYTYNASYKIDLNNLLLNGVNGTDIRLDDAINLILWQLGKRSEFFIGDWNGAKGVYRREDKENYGIVEL